MAFKRYFLVMIWMAFSVLSLSAKKEWNADNVPIPFLQDSTQYVSDPDGYVDKALKDSANFYLQKLKQECGVQNVLIIVGRVANQDAFRMAQDVGNRYGIGFKKSRRGLVVVIAVEDHKYFIAPGSGLEGELTDVDCDDIARACIVKYMREDAPGDNMAENIVETRIDGTEYTFCPASPWQEKMYWAITAVDRCGNESEAVQLVSPF